MKLNVLGKYGRFPMAGGGTSAFLVTCGKERILLDMGCSSLSKLLEHTDITGLSAVVLTHLHGDHCADYKAFGYMASIYRAEGRLNKNITVYLPATPKWIYKDYIEAAGIEFRVLKDGMKDRIGKMELEFFKLVHPVETYGVRISSGGKVLAYTSDTLLTDNLGKLIIKADVIVGDACILDVKRTPRSPHLTVKELAESAAKAGAGRLILAHLPDIGQDAVLAEAKASFARSELADDKQTYEI